MTSSAHVMLEKSALWTLTIRQGIPGGRNHIYAERQ